MVREGLNSPTHTGAELFGLTTMNEKKGSKHKCAHAKVVELFTAMHNVHYPSTTTIFHSFSLHNNSSTTKVMCRTNEIQWCIPICTSYTIMFNNPTYKSTMRQCINSYNHKFNQGAKMILHIVDKKKVVKRLSYIYMKTKINHTPMHFIESMIRQVIKYKSKCSMSYKLNTIKLCNQYKNVQ
jgi:hypothetical protein